MSHVSLSIMTFAAPKDMRVLADDGNWFCNAHGHHVVMRHDKTPILCDLWISQE